MDTPQIQKINWVQLIIVNLAVVLFILLPFIPGPSNKLIFALSSLGNFSGFLGLILVPVGCFWLVTALHKGRASRITFWLSVGTSIFIFLLCAIVVLASFGVYGIVTGVAGTAIVLVGFVQTIKSLKKIKKNPESRLLPVPLFLITIPIVAFCARTYLAPLMSNYSRNVAIERGQQLVTSIEEFKIKEGRYPETVDELDIKIPAPYIMGIDKFRYTRFNDDYFVAFSQWPDGGITEEIVLFGRLVPEKNLDSSDEYDYSNDLHRAMGAFTSKETGYKNWKYYLCD